MASSQPWPPMEGNDDSEGEQVADITSAADTDEHVPPTQTNLISSNHVTALPVVVIADLFVDSPATSAGCWTSVYVASRPGATSDLSSRAAMFKK
ncbi:hypothetical protein C2845_PM04G09010 [Panicum miliaceum]|uniref:Uncharacterized protein n=1 Tax=Panicum miliaceum TaxID=4540 RepID=A0A3L6QV35_PANMI|nr:hypothetical protein C2845_PM04G09010 [Panicum miliaceum]